jgi:hypothetical protein
MGAATAVDVPALERALDALGFLVL